MFPFWDIAIAPLIEASGAKRLLEIGALRGETTAFMLERLGPDAELHVIDPVPEFDPAEHEARFPGRYLFHRDLSLNVLPDLPPVDVALIDGDHNWYTVYNELKLLSATSRQAGAPLPLLILHDVGWPYGRRDLYYEPSQIPAEFRQTNRKKGMRPGRERVVPRNGVNSTLHNAVLEGGPRNGVMTALEDFIAEHDRPLRLAVVPIYFGLAVVAEESYLDERPQLRAAIDRIESAEGRHDLLELSESLRLDLTLWQHNAISRFEASTSRAVARYLDLLKSSLLDEHYLENELRIKHLIESTRRGTPPEIENLRDPPRSMRHEFQYRIGALERGRQGEHTGRASVYFPYSDVGRQGLDALEGVLDAGRTAGVPGDLLDCGAGRGGVAIFLRGYLEAHEDAKRAVWVADQFNDRHEDPVETDKRFDVAALQPDLNTVREGFEHFHLLDDRVTFLQGTFPETLDTAPFEALSFIHIGQLTPEEAEQVLTHTYRHLSVGGSVVVDDYARLGPTIDGFRARHGIVDPIDRLGWATATWTKSTDPDVDVDVDAPVERSLEPVRAPAPPRTAHDEIDLSIVVVFYTMTREAARTLHSLTRGYQQEIDDLRYEVIAIENGSDPDQLLGEEFVRSHGDEFRYLDLGDDAQSSPVPALNEGIARARGKAIALMIDGAHVLTPGVLRYGMLGMGAYEPAVVSTQQWYMGPGQQLEAMLDNYDQSYEDRLFDEIDWPADGYRLFDIGHFIGDRDWLDGMAESNCLFVPRDLLTQVGGFDEAFETPGGGYANLDLYERMANAPGVTLATMLGEGSFHQIHGGTTTNQPVIEERNRHLTEYASHYRRIRGHDFRGTHKQIHYVGTLTQSARRTRPRRLVPPHYFKRAAANVDGRPESATPIPDDLKEEFIEAYFDSLAWQKTTWLGQKVPKAPTDLFVYQELLDELRPDVIVETGTGNGGRAFFLAGICELLGQGEIITVDPKTADGRPDHSRITYVTGRPDSPETADEVRALVNSRPNVLVILGSRVGINRVMGEFDHYAPLVPEGSYVVIEDTIVNGHPAWRNFGPGPWEAVKRLAGGDFVSDATREKFGLTFNPRGFLKRVKTVD
jgi:cephalosporin hydroxylase/predicted O-methyltransferase YrrM